MNYFKYFSFAAIYNGDFRRIVLEIDCIKIVNYAVSEFI